MAAIAKKHSKNGSEPLVLPAPPSHADRPADWPAQLAALAGPVQFRRLKSKELVLPGDYVKEGEDSYQLWNGPRGFQAASFHKEVYRPQPKK